MAELRDQLSIETPELVSIDFPVAGIGSRFVALLIDYAIFVGAYVILGFLLLFLLPSLVVFQAGVSKWVFAAMIAIPFVVQWVYFTLFEALWNGQTPGKRAAGIRVIQETGRPIGIFESMARNFVRFVDQIPGVYAVGCIALFVNRRQQRLGDLVAGTLVVHDRKIEAATWTVNSNRLITAPSASAVPQALHTYSVRFPADGLARLTSADLQVMESFFARRLDMSLEVRDRLAQRLAGSIAAKMQMDMPAEVSRETFLEQVAFGLRELGRLH